MRGTLPLIVHVIHRLDYGGLENGLVNLVNRLPAERYRHAIVCLSGFNPEFRRRIQRDDIEVVSLEKRPGKDPGAYLRMWRVLQKLSPAIVHTRNLGTVDMQWVAAAAGVRHRVHGEHGWEASDPMGLGARSLLIRRGCRPVIHRYVPMSQNIASWLEASVGVSPFRIRQLYSGVDTERFAPAVQRSSVCAPDRVGVESENPTLTLGTVGRLDPVKNHSSLLRAFATLRPARSTMRLTIVGDGPLRAALEAEVAALGISDQVRFCGARDDTADLMRGFDVFVLPSVNEGISNTILEAMACGLPVVAGRVGGNPELIVEGVTGHLYDPADPEDLRQALLRYITDPALRQTHGQASRDRVVQNFSLDSMVRRYVAFYDELLSR